MKRDRYHHGDLRSALLQAAGESLRDQGVAGLSLREVARRAGVSHGAPAHHFPSKAALLTALAADSYGRMSQTIQAEMAARPPASCPAALAAIGRSYVRFAVAEPERFHLIFQMELLDREDPTLCVAQDQAFEQLRGVVRRCVDEGRLALADLETVVISAWSLVHGLASLHICGRLAGRVETADIEVITDRVTRTFVRGVLGPYAEVPAPPQATTEISDQLLTSSINGPP